MIRELEIGGHSWGIQQDSRTVLEYSTGDKRIEDMNRKMRHGG